MENMKMSGTRPGLSQYEQIRLDNIRQRDEMFRTLDINQAKLELSEVEKVAPGRRIVRNMLKAQAEVGERRRSSRVAGVRVVYTEEGDVEGEEGKRGKRPRRALVEGGKAWHTEEGAVARRQVERGGEGVLVSNDQADYVLVECRLCKAKVPLTRLRSHTATAHKVPISEYKRRFGTKLPLLETVKHRCGVCGELVLLDNDAIAVHLRRPGHPRVTHKVYNSTYMVNSSRGIKRGEEGEE